MDIAQRDEHAIQYTKHSALLEGDTLVVLKYPNGQRAYDAYGFPLSELHRVHSEKFLAIGSKFFKERLESEWLNHRAAKKARAFTKIPDGIKYFIDLTPPEEGDDAIELTSSLSCSPGVRYWFTAQSRLGVARNLVAGRDETTMPRNAVSLPTSPNKTAKHDTVDQNSGQPGSELSAANTSIIDGQTTGDQYRGVIPDKDRNGLRVPGDGAHEVQVKPDGTIEDDLAAATEKLKVEYLVEEVLDYCPIRHRACIERLLQVIEGKEPRLDSAPKVWTLAVLSKYFDCESTVADWVIRWVLAEPNCRIMEILPEATLKMGLAIRSQVLTRAGFSILVSEEALRVGTGKFFEEIKFQHKPKNNTSYSKGVTRFGRVMEDVDEDVFNLIQHAGRSMSSRIEKKLGELINRDMDWLKSIPEFEKLLNFRDSMQEFAKAPHPPIELAAYQEMVESLIGSLGDFVRGRIVFCLLDDLTYQRAKDGTDHRIAERWQSLQGAKATPTFTYEVVYNSLSDFERMTTRDFWAMLRSIEWDLGEWYSNRLCDDLPIHHSYHHRNHEVAKAHGIHYVNGKFLETRTGEVNAVYRVLNGTCGNREKNGPAPSTIPSAAPIPSTPDTTVNPFQFGHDHEIDNKTLDSWYQAEGALKARSGVGSLGGLPGMRDWFPESANQGFDEIPRFSLPTFFMQVQAHIRSICTALLSKGESDFSVLCDTLLCLTEDEYKFLPLWAGGMDDGSGGVFQEEIPLAEKGPIGPGPSFHTGSTVNSMDSEFEFDECSSAFASHTMEGIETSLGVEDGFSSHLDRRLVHSEEDFPMEHNALPVRDQVPGADALEHGGVPAMDGCSVLGAATLVSATGHEGFYSTTISRIDHEDFFNVQDDDEGDFDMEDSDSEGTITEE